MQLAKLLTTDAGRIIISVLLGVGFASVFRKSCEDKDCLSFLAPPTREMRDRVFRYGGDCYKYTPSAVPCDKSKVEVDFE